MHGLISELSVRHEIAVLAFKGRGEDVRKAAEATGAYARLVGIVENPHLGVSVREKRIGQLRSLPGIRSYEWQIYGLSSFQRSLDRMVREWRPDAVVVEFAQMGYSRFPDGIPVVLDAHNVEHEIVLRTARIEGSPARRVYSRINAWKLRREERDLVRRVDGLAVTSERDGQVFSELVPAVEPVVVPNAVDCDRFRPGDTESESSEILFIGAMDYFPNADAVIHFHRHVWPSLKQKHPEVRLNIVGRMPPAEVQALDEDQAVMVTGLVDDVREWISRAAVVVVPLRAGSGTRLKVLEAMAMSRPVVSTSMGVEGLDVESGKHLLIADKAEDFAGEVSKLLESMEERERIGRAARELAEAKYDWRVSAQQFDVLLQSVVERKSR